MVFVVQELPSVVGKEKCNQKEAPVHMRLKRNAMM